MGREVEKLAGTVNTLIQVALIAFCVIAAMGIGLIIFVGALRFFFPSKPPPKLYQLTGTIVELHMQRRDDGKVGTVPDQVVLAHEGIRGVFPASTNTFELKIGWMEAVALRKGANVSCVVEFRSGRWEITKISKLTKPPR